MPALNIPLDPARLDLIRLACLGKRQTQIKWIIAAIDAAILHQAHRRGADGAALAAELDRRAGAKKWAK